MERKSEGQRVSKENRKKEQEGFRVVARCGRGVVVGAGVG